MTAAALDPNLIRQVPATPQARRDAIELARDWHGEVAGLVALGILPPDPHHCVFNLPVDMPTAVLIIGMLLRELKETT